MAESMRLDKWLKIACLFKQRSRSTEAINLGEVKINGERVKPAKMIKIGDKMTIKRGHFFHEYEILGLATKSVSKADAKMLYREISEELNPEMEFMRETIMKERRQSREDWRESQGNKKQQRDLRKRKYEG